MISEIVADIVSKGPSVPATIQTSSGEIASPAYEAGVLPGDTVTAWNGTPVATFADLQKAVGATPEGESAVLTVERDGASVDLTVSPVTGAQGARYVGVTAGYEYVSASLTDVLEADWQMFTGTASVIVRLPQAVWQVGRSVVTDEQRDATGIVSVVGVGRMAGEVTGDSAALGLRDTRQVVGALLSLLASLNMALFVFNLIPLPPLDGGHILGAVCGGALVFACLLGLLVGAPRVGLCTACVRRSCTARLLSPAPT